jgi:hypothetical protein
MKDIKLSVLRKATAWLVGGDLFSFIQEEVNILMDVDMNGDDKRKKVIRRARAFFSDALNVFINIAIEVAVAWAKSKSPQGL